MPGAAKRSPRCSSGSSLRSAKPAAYLKDGGSELQKAADLLEPKGLTSPCIDDIAHAAANMLKHAYQHHPAFERFLSACGRVSGKLKQTLLASLAPPPCVPKPRFMNVHRLFTLGRAAAHSRPRRGQGRLSDLSPSAGVYQ